MGYLQLERAGNEFAAVPKADRRLHGYQVNEKCDGESDPSAQVVHPVEAHKIKFTVSSRIFVDNLLLLIYALSGM